MWLRVVLGASPHPRSVKLVGVSHPALANGCCGWGLFHGFEGLEVIICPSSIHDAMMPLDKDHSTIERTRSVIVNMWHSYAARERTNNFPLQHSNRGKQASSRITGKISCKVWMSNCYVWLPEGTPTTLAKSPVRKSHQRFPVRDQFELHEIQGSPDVHGCVQGIWTLQIQPDLSTSHEDGDSWIFHLKFEDHAVSSWATRHPKGSMCTEF